MIAQAKQRFQSFEEYLAYDDSTENLYELFNGGLIEVPPESGANVEIVTFLLVQFALMLGYPRVRGHGLELEVRGEPKNRYPDLTIIREEHIQLLKRRNTLRLSMAPPLLVIEVVSPGEFQHDRDYIAKRIQYQDCSIPEYWIVDPQLKTVVVLQLTGSVYTEACTFAGNEFIHSPPSYYGERGSHVNLLHGGNATRCNKLQRHAIMEIKQVNCIDPTCGLWESYALEDIVRAACRRQSLVGGVQEPTRYAHATQTPAR